MVTISSQRLAYLEERIVELDAALADYASRYGMTAEVRRLLVMELHTPSEAP